MTDLKSQKRMAADILGVGKNRVWIDPNKQQDVAMAITKEDIQELIEEGSIQAKDKKGTSRGRAREKQSQKQKGRSKGPGTKKGAKDSKRSEKDKWMSDLRAQRKVLKQLRNQGEISNRTYRELYKKSKGGEIRDIDHLKTVAEEMEE
ncbi:50S ribosomal protein L19e [archaeon SCG-AAA382B04]|nr:50S ribosomal protein L19e [archaeon SCG-AAA382B04]